jgi:hypothetical protein
MSNGRRKKEFLNKRKVRNGKEIIFRGRGKRSKVQE